MTQKEKSGKSRLIQGGLVYLWEELKTMNWIKFKALYRILSGYLIMRYRDSRKVANQRKLNS